MKPRFPTSSTERNGVFDISRFPLTGCRGHPVTPAEGSVKPTAGFTYNEAPSFASSLRSFRGLPLLLGLALLIWSAKIKEKGK